MSLLAVTLLAVAGCSSGTPRPVPAQTIALPLSTNADQSSQVRLHVGQRLGVATVHNAQSHAWTTGTSANSRIVHQDPEVTTEGCAPANAGCESEVQELYTATAVGDTDLTWSYQNLPSCSPAKDPRDPTPCVLGTMTVHVTVVK
ncbi:hypothetical protein OG500_09670 [Kitasatospora sp. NBC_01250]|uniref:hypothetical protein n=1 Tax=unclassified Kitasatospora TaxID=2633591 RepID=UPI002E0FECD3|nr:MULTISPECIES: hypothetical protein [unclassified Kitasatospora]WSJ66433.1 hypothetical protein OG294_10030 [Kitasatospora sp. NBC_01302]